MSRKDNRLPRKHNLLKRDFEKYDKAELVAEVININWPGILSLELGDQIILMKGSIRKLKKINKNDIRLRAKPWITSGIVKSIKRRDRLLRKYIYAKDTIRKDNLHTQYKTLHFRLMSKGQPTSMMIDNKLITDPTNIAEGFNNYFSSIAKNYSKIFFLETIIFQSI